jgi:hypothetical protein
MTASYDTSALTATELHLFDALKSAQTTQGDLLTLGATVYTPEEVCVIVDTEVTYDPVFEYIITVPRSQYSEPWTFAQTIPQGTGATITIENSVTLGLPSNLPFAGYYFIECYEPNDPTPRFTNAISWDADRHAVASAIYSYNACPNLRNKFEVIKEQIWNEDELNWVLYFENVDGNLPQFKIHKV